MKKIIIILLLFVFNTSVAKADIASGFEDNTNFKNKEDEFKKWSFAVARFEVLAWRRDIARSKERLILSSETIELMAEELDNETEQLELEREAIIQHCLGKLKQDQRSALKSLYEKSHETSILAKRFGKSITGFYQWIYRIRQKLSECAKKMTQPHSVN